MAMLSPKFDDLTIGHDFLFKKVMRNPRICKHLLEEVLQAPIAEISYPEIEKTIDVFMTVVVYVLMLLSLTKSTRIIIWKCK